MKILTKLVLLGLASLISQVALATGAEFKGNTTCSILQSGKLIKKAPCSYTGLEFGSIRYNESSYNYKVKGYGNMETSSSVSAKTDAKGEMVEGKDGSVEYNDSEVTLNKKPAIALFRDIKTLKVIPTSSYYKNSKKLEKTTLSCMQQIKSKLEICTPMTTP